MKALGQVLSNGLLGDDVLWWCLSIAAANPFDGSQLWMMPVAPLQPGETAVFRWVAVDGEGAPISFSPAPLVSRGRLSSVKEISPGVFEAEYVAPEKPGQVAVRLEAMGLLSSSTVQVGWPDSLSVRATPNTVVLGQTSHVSLKGNERGAIFSAVNGEVVRGDKLGFLPSSDTAPQLGLVVGQGTGLPGAAVVTMQGHVDYPVQGPEGAVVKLIISDREYGPVTLKKGRAVIPIEVNPGEEQGILRTSLRGDTTDKTLSLRIPISKRIAVAPLPKRGLAGSSVLVSVLVRGPSGEVLPSVDLNTTPTRGSVSAVREGREGWYHFDWSLPSSLGPAVLKVGVAGQVVQSESVSMEVVKNYAPKLSIGAESESVIQVDVGGKGVTFNTLSGLPAGVPRPVNGKLRVPFMPRGGRVEIVAFPEKNQVRGPVRSLVVLPDTTTLPLDGSTLIRVVALANGGLAVPHVAVSLSVDGDAELFNHTSKTNKYGIAVFRLVGGEEPGLLSLSSTAGNAVGVGVLAQVAEEGVDLSLSPAGTALRKKDFETWRSLVQTLKWVEPGASAFPNVEVERRAFDMGSTASVELSLEVENAAAAQGEPVWFTVRATVQSDEVHLEDPPSFSATHGRFGTPILEVDGAWAVQWMPDSDLEAEIVAQYGTQSARWQRPRPGARFDDLDEERELRGVSDSNRWFLGRASAVVGGYRYEQVPSGDPGDLVNGVVRLGGDAGSPALSGGLQLDARAFVPELPFLGAEVRYRIAGYRISSAAFTDNINDTLVEGVGYLLLRAPLSFQNNRVWVGARGGYRFDEVLVFTGCLEAGCTVGYSSQKAHGLGLGAEIGLELGPVYFIGGVEQGLARAKVPHSTTLDVFGGWMFSEHLGLDLGVVAQSRKMLLEGVESGIERGEVNDDQWYGTLGLSTSW